MSVRSNPEVGKDRRSGSSLIEGHLTGIAVVEHLPFRSCCRQGGRCLRDRFRKFRSRPLQTEPQTYFIGVEVRLLVHSLELTGFLSVPFFTFLMVDKKVSTKERKVFSSDEMILVDFDLDQQNE